MIPASLFRGLADLALPPVLRMLGKILLIGLAILLLAGAAAWLAIDALLPDWRGSGGLSALAGLLVAVLAGWFGWRVIAIALVNLFADEVVDAVEARHYPARGAGARKAGLVSGTAMALRSAGRALIVNLLASPVYLLLLVSGPGTAIAFLLVNGWLLGRDLEEMIANRHRAGRDDPAWSLPPATRFLFGTIGTALLAAPVVGLLAPAWIAAAATHLAHRHADRIQP